jgi:N-acetylmuramoyl-L-alanine amidase
MRKIIVILSISLITIFAYGCKDENKNVVNVKNNKLEEKQYKQKENKEVKEIKTIVIDPGHSSVGNSQEEPISPNSTKTKHKDVLGAIGVYTKIPEHKTTVSIGLILKEELEKNGFKVIMTKEKVETSLSNIERAEIGNKNNADLVIRIHADGANSQSVSGASILIPPKNEYTSEISDLSMDYGKRIIDTYTTNLNLKNRGCAYRDDMTGFNWSKVPVVILEMGFLTNIEEDKFISDTNNHEKIAKAIANGIYNCFY